jgi:hypothetical protein
MWDQVNDALRQSISRVLTSLASFIPGIAAFLVSVVLALALGALLAAAASRVLRWLRFDEQMERLGLQGLVEWFPSRSPTRLIGRLLFWSAFLLGLLIGIAALDATLMTTVAGRLLVFLPNVFVAVLLLVAGGLLARFLSRSVLISAVNMQIQSARLLGLGVKWLVLLLTAAMALNHVGIGGAILRLAFGILFGGIVLALALAVGLGSKDVVSRTWERQTEKRPDPDAVVPNL